MNDWPNYLIRQDFTEMGELLAEVPLGLLDESNQRFIASIFASYGPVADQEKWNLEESVNEFSLNGVEVLFNGLNGRDLPTFSTFKYALCLSFPERSTAPIGCLYLCWHDPVVDEPTTTTDGEE